MWIVSKQTLETERKKRSFSRDKVRVLLGLDPIEFDFNNPYVCRPDHDFAVAWAKMYGKGVFYSTLAHPEDNYLMLYK